MARTAAAVALDLLPLRTDNWQPRRHITKSSFTQVLSASAEGLSSSSESSSSSLSLSSSSSTSTSLDSLSDDSSCSSSVSSGCHCLVGLARVSPSSTSSASLLEETSEEQLEGDHEDVDADDSTGPTPVLNEIQFHFQNVSGEMTSSWTENPMEGWGPPSPNDDEHDLVEEDPIALQPHCFLHRLPIATCENKRNPSSDQSSIRRKIAADLSNVDEPDQANAWIRAEGVPFDHLRSVFERFVPRDARLLHMACANQDLEGQLDLDLICAGYQDLFTIAEDPKWIQKLCNHAKQFGLDDFVQFRVMEMTSQRLAFDDQWFDCVFCHSLLDLVASWDQESASVSALQSALLEVTRCVKPGGVFVVVTCRRKEYDDGFMAATDGIANEALLNHSLWWEWDHIAPLFRHHFELIHVQSAGIPHLLNQTRIIPFQVRVWRRKETKQQRWVRLEYERWMQLAHQKAWQEFEAIQRVRSAMQREEIRCVHEMHQMLEEELASLAVNRNDFFEQTRSSRDEIRRQRLAQWLQEERQAMTREDSESQSMVARDREVHLWVRDLAHQFLMVDALDEVECVIQSRARQRDMMHLIGDLLSQIIGSAVVTATNKKPSQSSLAPEPQLHPKHSTTKTQMEIAKKQRTQHVMSDSGSCISSSGSQEPLDTAMNPGPHLEGDKSVLAFDPVPAVCDQLQETSSGDKVLQACHEVMLHILAILCVEDGHESVQNGENDEVEVHHAVYQRENKQSMSSDVTSPETTNVTPFLQAQLDSATATVNSQRTSPLANAVITLEARPSLDDEPLDNQPGRSPPHLQAASVAEWPELRQLMAFLIENTERIHCEVAQSSSITT